MWRGCGFRFSRVCSTIVDVTTPPARRRMGCMIARPIPRCSRDPNAIIVGSNVAVRSAIKLCQSSAKCDSVRQSLRSANVAAPKIVLRRATNFAARAFYVVFGPRTLYRRGLGNSVWHSSNHCSGWPTRQFEETINHIFGVCPECVRIKHRENNRLFDPKPHP